MQLQVLIVGAEHTWVWVAEHNVVMVHVGVCVLCTPPYLLRIATRRLSDTKRISSS